MFSRFRLFFIATVLAFSLTRVAGADPGPDHEGRDQSVIRLVDLLSRAEKSSPLLDLESAKWAETLKAVERRKVFDQDFESFKASRAKWGKSATCRVLRREDDEGGKYLGYGGGGGHKCYFVLPAKPSTFYRIRRSVKTDDVLVDLRVLESRIELRHPKVLNHPQDVKRARGGRFIKAKNLLFVHRFPEPRTAEAWTSDDLYLFTTPFTRSLTVLVHDADSTVGNSEKDARFDDLIIERLEPDHQQELALLKGRDTAEGSDPEEGIALHGQLLPIHNAKDVRPPFDANHDYRYGLFAPAPSDYTFEIDVPRAARLHFGLGMLKYSRVGDAVTFRIVAHTDAQNERALFEKTLEIGKKAESWHWHDHEIGLDDFAGERVKLTLQTRSPSGKRGYGIWSSPMVDTARGEADPPNVLFIAIDTLRADRLSCYGYEKSPRDTSPNIDALAEDGVLFKRAITNSNWTTPSFASMFTGLPASRHQVVHRASVILPERKTLAEHFRENGWVTRGIAYKTYLYNMGFEQGFDTWFNLPRIDVIADDNLKKAIEWLEENGDQRFFMFLHFNDPHQPFNQPDPFDRIYNSAKDLANFGLRLPIIIGPHKGILGCEKCLENKQPVPRFKKLASDLYDGEVAYLDDRLGKLIEFLKKKDIYDDTIIALLADHGEVIYETGNFFGHGSHYLGDELVWAPLIIKPACDSTIPTGKAIDAQVRIFDVMPTLLDMVGIDIENLDLEAESLLEAMKSPDQADELMAFSENVKHQVLSIRQGEWTYLLDYRSPRPVHEKIFKRRPYPMRSRNLAGKKHAVLKRFRLHAMDFFMDNRSGRYMVVVGDGRGIRYRLTLRKKNPLRGLRELFGLPEKRRSRKKLFVFEGEADGRVLFFARLPVKASGKLQVVIDSLDDENSRLEKEVDIEKATEYSRGRLIDILGGEGIGVYLFDGSPRIRSLPRRKIDADRIEALRSLGYVE